MANSPLSEPYRFAGLTLRNRMVMAPMTRGRSPDWLPDEESVAYYTRRALGGVGMIVTEGIAIDSGASHGERNIPDLSVAGAVDAWARVTQAVHEAGTAIMAQLWHVGAFRTGAVGPAPDLPGLSPSGVSVMDGPAPAIISGGDFDRILEAYADCAGAAKAAGFDAVEIHAAHGYLLDQFFWSRTNKRTDGYGGTIGNRVRFAAEIVAAVRDRVGPQFPISLRFSQWKRCDFEARLAETPDILASYLTPLAAAGVDIFHASTRRYWVPEFEGSSLNLAGWARKITGKPAITVGSVGLDDVSRQGASPTDIDDLHRRLENEEFDLVAIGRQLLSDPDWPSKIAEGRGHEAIPFTRAHIDWQDSP